jgi:hypothetical protein
MGGMKQFLLIKDFPWKGNPFKTLLVGWAMQDAAVSDYGEITKEGPGEFFAYRKPDRFLMNLVPEQRRNGARVTHSNIIQGNYFPRSL